MNTLELNKVRKSYDKFVAVDDLSFNIKPGTMFGLLGPNGAGKTSTIRMMIGITYPDSGSVNMFGEPFRREHLQRVGYLPEERGLYPKMKVLDQLVFFGELHGLTRSDARTRANAWGERMDIAPSFGKKNNELSKGMQQKIQFIATLLHDPEFIIMDEPASGLDPVNAKLLEDVLLELNREGKTILFSSHRMDQVEKLCDSICLVNKGKAVLQGDLREIKGRYGRNTVEVAFEDNGNFDPSFLQGNPLVQSMNLYEGHLHLQLAPGADSQHLLRTVAERSRLNRFEVMAPSLEEIFIDVVGKANA
ncbi:MAG TPA: ATP-binding cassette domain-containing protein [Terriglobales bacterium]|nr:ATP-binding cassette domain-containing protein [Terriglobales bacterium]